MKAFETANRNGAKNNNALNLLDSRRLRLTERLLRIIRYIPNVRG
jgi:hypothetical protein